MEQRIETPGNVLLAGATRSGKTYHVRKMMREYLLKEMDKVIILSPTAHLSNDFHEFSKSKKVKLFTDPPEFKGIVDELITKLEKLKQLSQSKKFKGLKRSPNVLLIIDDALGLDVLKPRGRIDSISVSSRHLGLSIMVLIQKLTAIPRTFRTNCKYIYFFNVVNFKELEMILEEYTPRKYKKQLMKKLEEIFNIPHTHIMSKNFENKLTQRLWLNSKENLIELIKKES